jgi:hypothetical protein
MLSRQCDGSPRDGGEGGESIPEAVNENKKVNKTLRSDCMLVRV